MMKLIWLFIIFLVLLVLSWYLFKKITVKLIKRYGTEKNRDYIEICSFLTFCFLYFILCTLIMSKILL